MFQKNNAEAVVKAVVLIESSNHRRLTESLKTLKAQKALPQIAVLTLLNPINYHKAEQESFGLSGYIFSGFDMRYGGFQA